ncbi:Carbohydrate binding domain (family 25) [Pelotomaculum schinkii]|uniref:Carbohydrate binding domain (Family 25) n=1 Tax=Pelotomaculum schinkii TaxID=78350 RepID=A0A4Y7R576_9FIRM|nr:MULTISPECIES: carbohydrate-binding protein [Pelotomaculum]TEB04158.1 Carbohydrate binding domain (family 25) [Pelotomaculum schinkii]TEB17826.1 Carbohydrate binding domain (family 25) [Pelotomaculum sp. FP]
MSSIKPFTYSHSIQGVQVKPLSEDGRHVSILYKGLLANQGAASVYLHYGYGEQQDWLETIDQPMEQRNDGWEKAVRLEKGNQLNFCFKDNSNHWDNNNGTNWAYRISE